MKEEFNLSKEQEKIIKEIEDTLIHKLVEIDFSWLMRRIGEIQFNDKEFIKLLKEEISSTHGAGCTALKFIDKIAGDKLI